MSDFERRLSDSLKQAGESYRPSDPVAAREAFLGRRRRRAAFRYGVSAAVGVAAIAAGAFVVVGSPGPTEREEGETVAGDLRPVVATQVPVGSRPTSVAVGEGFAWAVDPSEGTLTRIDPSTDRTLAIDVGGAPDDLVAAYGSVWVADSARGRVTRVDPSTGDVVAEMKVGDGGHLDLAFGAGSVWVLERGGDLHKIDVVRDERHDLDIGGDPADVAVTPDAVWVFDNVAGEVARFDPITGRRTASTLVGRARYADLAVGLGAVWLYRSDDGAVYRIDPDGGEITGRVEIGGAYAGLAAGEGALWAVVGDGTGTGTLVQIDGLAARPVGTPVPLGDDPFDVDVGGGAVWVTQRSGGTVTRLELVPAEEVPEPAPATSPPEPAPLEDAVLLYSDGQDVYAHTMTGDSVLVVGTPATETNPTVSPDGTAIVFQRGDYQEGAAVPELVRLDIATGTEEILGAGAEPAYGPDGRLAWVVPDPDSGSLVMVGEPGTDGAREPWPGPGTRGSARSPAWSEDGSRLAYEFWHDTLTVDLIEIDLEADVQAPLPVTGQKDRQALAPVPGTADETLVITVCCTQGGKAGVETATLESVGPSGPSGAVVRLDDVGLDANSAEIFMVAAGDLAYDPSEGWTQDKGTEAWIVGDGAGLWLVDGAGASTLLPIDSAAAVAVNPPARRG